MDFSALKIKTLALLSQNEISAEKRLEEICGLLKSSVPYYNWVGFYFKNGDKKELKLRAFAGEPTEHTIIPFGKGICGQTAVSGKNFVVPNVESQENYLSCNINVKSEIVVPLFLNGENIGQIDIDSHVLNPFSEKDERFLEFVNQKVAEILKPVTTQ